MVSLSNLPILGALFRRASLAIQWRIDEQTDALAGRLGALSERIDHLEHRAGLTERRLDDELRFVVDEVRCIGPQVASIEQRIEDSRRAETTESAGVIDAAAEHARARVRLSAVSMFEERLRRLEETAAPSRVPHAGAQQ